ncbi:MAG: Amino-acid carrier protein AlsT [Verrucomicrobiae bacterium]|nr:Amino-acid carrier protein AlsT [Verrucomicrobiae bacterium]
MEQIQAFIDSANDVLWGQLLIYLLLGTGAFFTIRTGVIQLRLFGRGWTEMTRGLRHGAAGDITPFQAFATGMASRVGTGNIVGVAMAISLGGPGAVFWMWMTALLGMASALVESTLAQIFKVPHGDATFRGGPAYYIQLGLRQRWLGVLFALALLLAFGFVFNAIQANSIAAALHEAYGIAPATVGIGLVVLTALIIFGGIRSVAVVTEFMVPLMALFYLGLALYAVAANFRAVPGILVLICKSAFGFGPATAGFLGYSLAQAMTLGVKRGLFSNEAGMGSAPNAAATAAATHPATQGILQMFGVFVDTMVVCTCTALLILLSGDFVAGGPLAGVALVQAAMQTHVGSWGKHFLVLAVFFFAFSSVLGNYAYAEVNVDFLKGNKLLIGVFRLLVLAMVYFGAVSSVPFVWSLGDLSQALMAIINLVAILLLSGVALKVIQDYERQLKAGIVTPVFSRSQLPEVAAKLPQGVW